MSATACENSLTRGKTILDKTVVELGLGRTFKGMSSLLESLWFYRTSVAPEVWKRFCAEVFTTHPLRKLVHLAPLSRRAFAKPRGYAGDASTLDFIYDNSLDRSPNSVARALYEWEFQTQSCRSVRARKDMIAGLIDETAARCPKSRIASIACGHARELSSSAAVPRGAVTEFTAFDQDPESLRTLGRDYPYPCVVPVQGSIRAILAGRVNLRQMDLVYSAGLYDYLAGAAATRLTARLFRMLRPGGKLILVNFTPELRDAGYMEAAMDWWLIYRTERQMQGFISEIPADELASVRTFNAANNTLAFIEIVRS